MPYFKTCQKKERQPLKAEDYVTQIILSVVEAARSKVNILYERRTCEVCMYDDIAEETGYETKALRNIKYVADNVELSRRKDNLSFSHHVEVASLPPEWLDTFYPHGATRYRPRNSKVKVPNENLKMPVTKKESHLLQWLSKTDLK